MTACRRVSLIACALLLLTRGLKDFMIQGGGFTPQMRLKTTRPPIKNEATGLMRNERGAVAA